MNIQLRQHVNDTKEVKPVVMPRSATAENAMAGLTQRYQFISTADTVKSIESLGYVLHSVSEAKANKEEKKGYQKHLLRFRLPSDLDNAAIFKSREGFPEIVVVNSHDGTSAMRIMAGYFRLACANGLISGSITDEMRIRHVTRINVDPKKELEESLKIVADRAKQLSFVAASWQQKTLDDNQVRYLVNAAVSARIIGTKYQGENVAVNTTALLNPKREADRGSDLWTVFNVLQEKAIKQPLEVRLDDGEMKTLRTTRSLDRIVAINKALWQAAENVAA